MSRGARVWVIVGVTLAVAVALSFFPPISQGLAYHNFADQRAILGIPHCFDVLSNVPFLLVGTWGLVFLLRPQASSRFVESRERWPYVVFFLGVALTGLGSAYCHLAPGNARLVWDRLPMTFAFMSLLAAMIVERVSVNAGLRLLLPLVGFGIASVAYWHLSELQGRGDLRLYLLAQFYPVLAVPLMIFLFPPRYSRTQDLLGAFGFYVLAKLFELLDRQVYALGRIVSGHTLKHLAAALATYWILGMLERRSAAGMSRGE